MPLDTINERITYLRKNLGYSQQRFAEQLGTSRDVIANIDNNRNTPSPLVISSICREFRVSREWLETGSGEMLLPEDEDEAVNRIMLGGTDFQKALFRVMAKLPDSAWEELQRFAEALKKESGL